ncbi:CBS domain [Plasmopara halstedii]|uniref:CBS domain n=1 Tax=Plasmopara halstedii TaxID=4781 RepID=A0A0N7L5B6_PLAHL|nr:CBS domain [Plasmopara halstedii]CEG41019.1 CBS domain [Plasmopara halstedii]|eukprot:XP_024577388.1 CBS domain [Plasmopara halstedii]
MGSSLASHDLSDPQLQRLLSEYVHHITPQKPRYIDLEGFEEIFGMLVADPEPHFQFFYHGKIVSADMKPKDDATDAQIFTCEARSVLIQDFAASVSEVLQLADPISNSVLQSIQKALYIDVPEKLMTMQEIYNVCLTNPQISRSLLSVHMVFEDFSSTILHEKMRQREHKGHDQQMFMLRERDMTRFQLTTQQMFFDTPPPASLLWDLKVGDYGNICHNSELLRLQSSEGCAQALSKMAQYNAQGVLVVEVPDNVRSEKCQILGFLSAEKFLHCLVPDLHMPATKLYEHTQARAEKTIMEFGTTPLRNIVDYFISGQSSLLGIVREDETFYNVLLRFACGESVVAVAQDRNPLSETVLGYLTIHDMLSWLDEDLALLKGKEYCAVAMFPQVFHNPATIDCASDLSVCEGLVKMELQKLSAILVKTNATTSILSADTFRDLYFASFSASGNDSKSGPLLQTVAKQAAALVPATFISLDTSIAVVIREMIDKRARRVIIRRHDNILVGSVRASDIVLMLLQEQHTSLY